MGPSILSNYGDRYPSAPAWVYSVLILFDIRVSCLQYI